MASGTIPYVPTVPIYRTNIPANSNIRLTFAGNARAFLFFSSRSANHNGIATVALGSSGSATSTLVAGASGLTITPSGYNVTIAATTATDVIVLGAIPMQSVGE